MGCFHVPCLLGKKMGGGHAVPVGPGIHDATTGPFPVATPQANTTANFHSGAAHARFGGPSTPMRPHCRTLVALGSLDTVSNPSEMWLDLRCLVTLAIVPFCSGSFAEHP